MPEPESREEVVFSRALELSGSERRKYLDEICDGNELLRIRVENLLSANESSEGFLETSSLADFPVASDIQRNAPVDEAPGDRIGRYKLLEKIGEGGWGVVWMAEQKDPIHRRVALKILKLGMDTKEVVARFESERQALAMMSHPNIAKVFDGGTSPSGRPFFVMELVRGIRITDYCDSEKLPSKDRLRLFVKVCQAVQHAHQKGVIHRDLKPSNILVSVDDGEAVPKVIDFGIVKAAQVKLTDKTLFTRFHSFVGTPIYTSPEQMQMSSVDVDTRSDVYSLGVLLYELLSGNQPFSHQRISELGIDALRKIISEEDPPLPSEQLTSLNQEERTLYAVNRNMEPEKFLKELKGELDWIVMKCLEKNRSRRYETVNALSMDIERYMNREPVLARNPSKLYRVRKLIDRNRLASVISAALILSLIVGAIMNTWLAYHARRSEGIARMEARKSIEISESIKDMFSYFDSLVELQLKGAASTELLKESLNEAVNLAESRIGNLMPEARAELYDILGAIYFKIREYESAERMFRLELEGLNGEGESDLPALARSNNHLGAALGRQGKLEAAEFNIREALRIEREFLERDSHEVARSLVSLSVIQTKKASQPELTDVERQGELLNAEESIKEALEIQRTLLGGEHEEIAASLNELGFILSCQGGSRLKEAEEILVGSLAMNRKIQGEVSPGVASSLNLLAIAQVLQDKYSDALANYRMVQSIRRKLGNSSNSVLSNIDGVSVWEHQNTGEESLKALHDVVELTRLRYPPEGIEAADLLAIQAFAYLEERQFAKAETTAGKSLEIRKRLSGDHWTYFHSQSLLGAALTGLGRMEEAEPLMISGYRGIKSRRDQLEKEHEIRLPETLFRLIGMYQKWGKSSELERWLIEAEELNLAPPL